MADQHSSPGFADDDLWTMPLADGLICRATERPGSPLLEQFFAGYDRAFILPDEREELDGFRACLAINPVSRHRFGRLHRELVMIVGDAVSGTLLGGANFLATRVTQAPAGHPPVAVALNYLFVETAARGRGLARTLKQAVGSLANRAVDAPTDAPAPALFIEQNDPLRLSDEDYVADSAHAGIDQVDRLAVWARLGALLVDFPYVQPALSADQESDDGLAYAVMNLDRDSVDAHYLRAHLESFFGISVLKGGNPQDDLAAGPQLAALAAMATHGETVPLLRMQPAIDALRGLPSRPKGVTFREYARGLG
jgi:GNAT superfamily N-acetyltransferase